MEININLGSGPQYVDSWINYDKSPNILLSKFSKLKRMLFSLNLLNDSQALYWDPRVKYADIRKIKFPDNSVDNFYLSHVLEHVYFDEAAQILRKCFLSLKKGGVLRICSPDYEKYILKYIQESKINELEASSNFNDSLLSYPKNRPSLVASLISKRSGHIHYWHPFKSQLVHLLFDSGFSKVEIRTFRKGVIPSINEIETRSEFSFYLEAFK